MTASKLPCCIELYELGHHVNVPRDKTVVLVGGCFDLLHYGHIKFLEACAHLAPDTYIIIALEPDARILEKGRPFFHAQAERAQILSSLRWVDHVLVLPQLAHHQEYVQLVRDIQPHMIGVTQHDPHIAQKQACAAAVNAHLRVVLDRIEPFSSTAILHECAVSYIFQGIVVEGLHKARKLGYPTANLHVETPPAPGVYSCWVHYKDTPYPAMAYYDPKRLFILEVHLFDFSRNLYGEKILVTLKRFIRSPEVFQSLEMLKDQIDRDANMCCKDLAYTL